MNTRQIMQDEDTYLSNTYARYGVAVVGGSGVRAKGSDGREYIDFTSGIGVNSLGYCDPGWVGAVSEQAARVQHTSNLFYTEPCTRAAKRVIERTGMGNVFFGNSGAEANEGAIKAARKYSHAKYGVQRSEIITLEGSFHGRTMATITATGQDAFHKDYDPFLQGFVYAGTGDIADLRSKVSDRTCAVMAEFVQGEGGVNPLGADYVKEMAAICAENDILLIADEVQSGAGRTGRFMAYEHYGVKPDIVTVAKGIGGGLPIGAIIFGEKTKDTFTPGDHGSTYGGNPVACAGADYVLSRMDEGFLEHVREVGGHIKKRLLSTPGVAGVTGLGLMIGVALENKKAPEVVKSCIDKGLFILTAKDKLRLLPPLIITKEEADEGIEILKSALAE
ncbi:MAG: aspartate aminotransferase family protein [Clostridiales Family XIII bacterium]|jgi:acetylornithine/N-succinyldiaminopimelate aminotransferase|nr:aspartate aminotransferase family protein [Clostridiales Family XIII bacterium]